MFVVPGSLCAGTRRVSQFRRLLAGIAVFTAFGLTGAGAAHAQDAEEDDNSISRPVVQALPSRDSLQLSSALSRLGRDPRDISALIDAGNAALSMGDVDASVGFFKRANQVSPGDPRVKVGLAGAMVRNGDPIGAIGLFNEAERGGAPVSGMAAERGLAYDLVGDNATAQKFYRLALAGGEDEEVTRRLAVSQAIAGDARAFEATLLPLLRSQDKAAWRTRAFALAISGDTEQAVKITRTILPEALATQVTPYLRYMPQLTPAQQAAAANLGSFPRASEIGRDDPRIAAFAPVATRPKVAVVDSGLVPKGEPLGAKGRPSSSAKRDSTAASAPRDRRAERKARESARATERAAAATESAKVAARVAPPEVRPTRAASEELPPVPSTPAAAASAQRVAANTAAAAAVPAARATGAAATPPVRTAATTSESPADILTRATPAGKPAVAARSPSAAESAAARPATEPSSNARAAPTQPAGAQAQRLAGAIQAGPAPSATSAASASSGQPVVAPGFDLAKLPAMLDGAQAAPAAGASPAASAVVQPMNTATNDPPRQSIADAFSDLSRPTATAAPAPGAVDISRIKPAKPKPKVEEKPEPAKPVVPSHPSRIWVQLGIGRDVTALGVDWRKLVKRVPDAFKGRNGFYSEMGASNRMLAGPFESAKAANTFITLLKAEEISGPYIWNSPAGQVVDALPGK